MFDMSVKHRPPLCSITIMALRTGCKHRCGVALVRFQRNILISAYLMLSTTAKCYANYLTYLALSEPVVLSGLRNGTPALQFNFNNSKNYFPSATFLWTLRSIGESESFVNSCSGHWCNYFSSPGCRITFWVCQQFLCSWKPANAHYWPKIP